MSATRRAVIVGTGIAGVSAAEGLRAAGWDGEVVLVGDDPELPYRRPPLSKELLAGSQGLDEIRIKKSEWYAAHDVELVTGRSVVGLDPGARSVQLAGRRGATERVGYDVALLATGGRARTLPVDGAEGSRSSVLTLRSAADAAELRSRICPGSPVIVVGAGLVGSEVAATAVGLGAYVTLLETGHLPLQRLLPAQVGRRYVQLHRERGVDLHTGVEIAGITQGSSAAVVLAQDGRSWTAPTVVVATGMAPRVELAVDAGLDVDPGPVGGVVVDGLGRTSAPGVFAAGDVANLPDGAGDRHRVEHWQHAQRHGLAVGRAMAGAGAEYAEVPWCWSNQFGLMLQAAGRTDGHDELVVRGSVEDLDFAVLGLVGGVVIGAVAIGRPAEIRTVRGWISSGTRLDPRLAADDSVPLAEAAVAGPPAASPETAAVSVAASASVR